MLCAVLSFGVVALGQGTITFNESAGRGGTYYEELGMGFHLIIPPGTSGRDDMAIGGPFPPGGLVPQNNTPYMVWIRQFNPQNYVSLSLTNGSLFGLTAVWLADPTAPSPAPVSISFIGYLSGGGTLTNTFTTPGNGATTFANYTFNPDFSSPVFTHVDILAPRWGMDNLVFVIPEPSALSLILLGGGVFVHVRHRPRKC